MIELIRRQQTLLRPADTRLSRPSSMRFAAVLRPGDEVGRQLAIRCHGITSRR